MSIEFRISRPFPQWRLKPGVGEPSYSYFARLVAEEQHSSVTLYAESIGLNGRNIRPGDFLESLLCLPLTQDQKDMLTASTPIRNGNFYDLNGEKIHYRQFSHQHRRFCPHCLAADAYYRVWWDVQAFNRCAAHGTSLVETVDGKKLEWWWPHLDRSPNDTSLLGRRNAERVDGGTLPFHEFMVRRLTAGEPKNDVLAEFELWEVIEAASDLSNWLQSTSRSRPVEDADIEFGYSVLVGGHAAMVKSFREWFLRVVPDQYRRKGLFASSRRLASAWLTRMENRLLLAAHSAMTEAFAMVGKFGRKRSRVVPTERFERTLLEVSRELGLPPKGLSKFTRFLGLLPDAKWNGDVLSFDQETFEKLRNAVGDLVQLDQTFDITGIPAHEFRELEKAGFITGHFGLPINGSKSPKFPRSEIEELIQRAMNTVKPQSAKPITLFSLAKWSGKRQGEIVCSVLRGEITPIARDEVATGFRQLLFRLDDPALQGSALSSDVRLHIIRSLSKISGTANPGQK